MIAAPYPAVRFGHIARSVIDEVVMRSGKVPFSGTDGRLKHCKVPAMITQVEGKA